MQEQNINLQQVAKIAKLQKAICWLFLGMILCLAVPTFGLVLSLAVSIGSIFYVYRLAQSLEEKRSGLYALGMFVPIIKLFVLLYLIQKATKVLRAHGLKVGLMGVCRKDIAKLT